MFRLFLPTLLKAEQDFLTIKPKEEFLPFFISSLHFMLPGKATFDRLHPLGILLIISANYDKMTF